MRLLPFGTLKAIPLEGYTVSFFLLAYKHFSVINDKNVAYL